MCSILDRSGCAAQNGQLDTPSWRTNRASANKIFCDGPFVSGNYSEGINDRGVTNDGGSLSGQGISAVAPAV
jgi:hypothetical protein